MKKYYYICPRCGRRWRFFIPRKRVKCGFCGEEWSPKKRRHGVSSRFSWTATFLWLFWALVVVLIAARVAIFFDPGLRSKVPPILGGETRVEKLREQHRESLERDAEERAAEVERAVEDSVEDSIEDSIEDAGVAAPLTTQDAGADVDLEIDSNDAFEAL